MAKALPGTDLRLIVDGSISLLEPVTPAAVEWIEENISQEGYQPFWPTVVIEHRYLRAIVNGLAGSGLAVRQ